MIKKLVLNRTHLEERLCRVKREHRQRIINALLSLDKKKLPNTDWYRAVRGRENEVLGYLCGRGNLVCTNLGKEMIPKGKEI